MDAIWDAIGPAIPGLVIALIGVGGTIWVTILNRRAAQSLAAITAAHTLRTQRSLERDKAGRERRSKRIEGLLEQVRTEVEQIIALQNALESGDATRVDLAMQPLSGRVRRPLAPAIAAIPESSIRAVFSRLSDRLAQAQELIATIGNQGQVIAPDSFTTTIMLPMLQDVAELDRLLDAYVLGPEP